MRDCRSGDHTTYVCEHARAGQFSGQQGPGDELPTAPSVRGQQPTVHSAGKVILDIMLGAAVDFSSTSVLGVIDLFLSETS